MPKDVHKSLELLEGYHAELYRPSDAELKGSIEKVIGIFKANLFNALCDIQELYDGVLLNERMPLGEKVFETRRFTDRWEQRPPLAAYTSGSALMAPPGSTTTTRQYYSDQLASRHTVVSRPDSGLAGALGSIASTTAPLNRLVDELGREWEVEEVLLDATQTGLGFSISGGRDREPDPDYYIRVTDISPGGAVARDGRIKIGDVILRVNESDCVDVEHQHAVNSLQRAGPFVRLLVKRLKPQRSLSQSHLSEMQRTADATMGSRSRSLHQLPQQQQQQRQLQPPVRPPPPGSFSYTAQAAPESTKAPRSVMLRKGDGGLGFNIVGGEDGEPIYVSHVLPGGAADLSGAVRKGDVLLRVNDIDLQGATHTQAAMALKGVPPGSYVQLLVQYRPREFHHFEDRVERLRQDLLAQQQSATVGFR